MKCNKYKKMPLLYLKVYGSHAKYVDVAVVLFLNRCFYCLIFSKFLKQTLKGEDAGKVATYHVYLQLKYDPERVDSMKST